MSRPKNYIKHNEEILNYIHQREQLNAAITINGIRAELHLSTWVVMHCLADLQKKNLITHKKFSQRTLHTVGFTPTPIRASSMNETNSRSLVFNFIVGFINEHGYSPTLREISAGIPLSKTAVVYQLYKLTQMKKINSTPFKSRSIEITP